MCLQFSVTRKVDPEFASQPIILLLHTIPLLTWSQISSSPVSPGLQDGRSGYTVQYCCQHIRPDVCWYFAAGPQMCSHVQPWRKILPFMHKDVPLPLRQSVYMTPPCTHSQLRLQLQLCMLQSSISTHAEVKGESY